MNAATPPIPVVFEPLYMARPWGGRALERLFGKRLPAGQPIGESWELVSLPGADSRVRDGPHAGRSLGELMKLWGKDLLGGAEAIDGSFPLLIKFLDARERLSVQVHPKPPDDDPNSLRGRVKHEAWYVVHADPGAELFIGLKEGVGPDDLATAARSRSIVELLRSWPAKAGQCYYLPSGTPHALGGGLVVVEVQTPSDVTYRLYDWDRVDGDGNPRELHVPQALANVRVDVPGELINPPRSHLAGVFATVTRLVACEHFLIDKVRLWEGVSQGFPHVDLVVWVVLEGGGELRRDRFACRFGRGDVVLIPADSAQTRVQTTADCELLEVKVPVRSSLAGLPRPERETLHRPDAPVSLTRAGVPLPDAAKQTPPRVE